MKLKLFTFLLIAIIGIATPLTNAQSAESATDFEFLSLGTNNNAASSKMLVRMKISGGNSSKATSCSSYLVQEGSKIQLGLSETGQIPGSFFWSGTSGSAAKTVSLDAKSLTCEFYTTPAWSLKSDARKWSVQIVLLYDGRLEVSQPVTLWNPNSSPPSITINSPTRGSKVTGELNLVFLSDGKDIWSSRETFVYVVEGWDALCRGGGGATINSIGQSGSTSVVQNNSVSNQVWPLIRVEATRTSENSVAVNIQSSGKYTVCVGQSFGSKFDPNPPEPSSSEIQFANTGVAIDYIAAPRNINLDINDSRLKRLDSPIYYYLNTKLTCPKSVKTDSKTITCTLTSNISPFSDYDVQKIGFSSGTKLTLSANLNYAICVKAEDWGRVACENKSDLIPAYYAHIKSVDINLGQSIKVSVPNFLSKTGFTSIECGLNCSGSEEYEVKGYSPPDVRQATAVPTASEQRRILGAIKKGMNERCQKLPSGFSTFQGKYVKRVTSPNGLYGFIFTLGSKISIQIYEAGSVYWTFGPSPTKTDNKTWDSWGCGKTGIQTYG